MSIDWSNILVWIVVIVLVIIALSFFFRGAFTIIIFFILIAIVYLIYKNYTKEGHEQTLENFIK